MKKYIESYFKENKSIVLIGGVALIIIFSYLCSFNCEEWFKGAGEWFNCLYNFSISYIVTIIFYTIQSYNPNYRRRLRVNGNIKLKLNSIAKFMITPIKYMGETYLSKKYNDLLNADEVNIINSKLNIDDDSPEHQLIKINTGVLTSPKTYLQILEIYIGTVHNEIEELYRYFGNDLDIEITELLAKIKHSEYNQIFIMIINNSKKGVKIEYSSDSSQESNQNNILNKYYNLYNELLVYIDKMIV